ncbi:MAG TPA: hypothetical protein VEG67_09565, partial [Myxococcota bacterium]|nr:hypothetical protein [Myxococcota bacterium]
MPGVGLSLWLDGTPSGSTRGVVKGGACFGVPLGRDVAHCASMGSSQLQVRSGRIVALFAFDVAAAIDLQSIPSVLRPERSQIIRSRPAPEYVSYAEPPVDIVLGERELELGGEKRRAVLSARLFDFGAVSVALAFALDAPLATLPALAQEVARADLAVLARRALHELVQEIRPAFRDLGLNELVEDYYVFELRSLEPATSAEALLRENASVLAETLSMDPAPLSRQQIEETLRDAISYSPDDLVVAEWSGALVCDAHGADTLAVLEFLNVQLLEMRFLDARLDRALAEFSREVYRSQTLWEAVRGLYRSAIRALSELMVEVLTLSERVENAVKLAPDVYLARVHRRCAARLGLPTWERMVQSKLETVRHLTTILTERAAARRAEA